MAVYEIQLSYEDGQYLTKCPDIPGYLCHGNTEEEAINSIKEFIEHWLWSENEKTEAKDQQRLQEEDFTLLIKQLDSAREESGSSIATKEHYRIPVKQMMTAAEYYTQEEPMDFD